MTVYGRSRNPGQIDSGVLGINYFNVQFVSGPLAQYRMDDTTTTLTDTSGNGRFGVYSGAYTQSQPSIIPSLFDASVKFDGFGSGASVTAAAWMNVSSLTIECVMSTTSATWCYAMGRDGPSGSWYVGGGVGQPIQSNLRTSGTSGAVNGTFNMVSDTAYHVIATYNSSTSKQMLWVDGVKQGEFSHSGSLLHDNNLWIGRSANGSYYFPGKVQGIALYGRVLSDNEIANHFAATGL